MARRAPAIPARVSADLAGRSSARARNRARRCPIRGPVGRTRSTPQHVTPYGDIPGFTPNTPNTAGQSVFLLPTALPTPQVANPQRFGPQLPTPPRVNRSPGLRSRVPLWSSWRALAVILGSLPGRAQRLTGRAERITRGNGGHGPRVVDQAPGGVVGNNGEHPTRTGPLTQLCRCANNGDKQLRTVA